MMKSHKSRLALAALLLFPVLSQADDTEIYFAKATADNKENKPVANVLYMLDTSGSMRFCKESEQGNGGYDAGWCSDAKKRRINMLQEAMRRVLEDAGSNIRVGLGRFNYLTSGNGTGQIGGRIDIPVVGVNSDTLPSMLDYLETLNAAGDSADGGSAGSPVGDTPTARAYSEAARYMMGAEPKYGVNWHGADNSPICTKYEIDESSCRDEVQSWNAFEEIDGACDVQLDSCESQTTSQIVSNCNYLNDPNCVVVNWNNWGQWQNDEDHCDASHPVNYCMEWVNNSYYGTEWRRKRTPKTLSLQETIYRERTPDVVVEVCDEVCVENQELVSEGRYVSPINLNNQCETNHLVLFTDGQPSSNDKPGSEEILTDTVSCGGGASYNCQIKISKYLSNESNAIGRPVKTYNVGLYMDDNKASMEAVSTDGASGTFSANDVDSLVKSFQAVMDLIDEDSRSIATPGVSVNRMNRFEHLDQLYYSVFQPEESSFWEGNIKRYRLKGENIVDANGNNAVDDDTGYFSDSSKSFWGSVVDGDDATLGGARGQLKDRKLFYGDSGALTQLEWDRVGQAPYTNDFFGLNENSDEKELERLAERLKTLWGDPLHSVPVLVNYGGGENDNVIFLSTNAGMLHAVNAETGEEIFAFMPNEFISKADNFTTNRLPLRSDNTRPLYGLDGSWVAWHRSNGQRLLFGGMRRGGRSYYALDVTNLNAPSVKWKITPDSSGFGNLGQTWSTPTLTQIPGTNGGRPVLVFGGGYSPQDHDGYKSRNVGGDREGNAIYIVDAESGELVWSASNSGASTIAPEMKWSVPASIAVVDIDFNGLADYFYFADLGGQLFRVDIDQSGGGKHTVNLLASLVGNAQNPRRFYEAPAVAYVEQNGEPNIYVAFSSGYRAHPLDEKTDEAFFVVRDKSAIAGETPKKVLSLSDLEDITGKDSIEANEGGVDGWYFKYSVSGEKSLSSPLIFDNKIYFGTFAPLSKQEEENPCAVRVGQAFLHVVDLLSGKRIKKELEQDTPPPTPVVVTQPTDNDGDDDGGGDDSSDGSNRDVMIIVGTESLDAGAPLDLSIRKRNWRQLRPDDANFIGPSPGGK